MKRIGYKDILISIDELLCLVTNSERERFSNTIKMGLRRFREMAGKNWVNVQDVVDKRKRLVYYASIPEKTKQIYGLPSLNELILASKNEKAFDKLNKRQSNVDLEDVQVLSYLEDAADNHYIKFCPQYLSLFPNEQDKVITYARTHSVANALLTLRCMHKVSVLHGGYLQIKGLKSYVTNYNEFCEKLSNWAKNGINLVHKLTGTGQNHLKKITDFHIGKMEQYYSHPNQYTYQMITDLLNADCETIDLKKISLESVKKYLGQSEVKNRLSFYRSREFYRKNIQPFARRKAALYSGDLYYADGSPIQIFCWNKQRTKLIRLNLFAVMDVRSAKIVGFDLAENEDRYNWFAAFKMAFNMEMLLPYEVVYDNASATKTEEFKALKEMLLIRGCRLNPAEKGNPQHKSQLERWFGTFQTGYQRMIEGFTGEGIRSKRTNGRIDAEFWSNAHKKDGHFTWDSMIMIITQLIATYNQKAVKNRKAPSRVFEEGDRPNAVKISNEDLALLFWHHKKLKVNRSEVSTTIRHTEYHYKVYDHNQALAINGQEVNMYYDEADMSRVHIFSLTGKYLGELRQTTEIVSAKANQTENDVLDIIKESKHNGSIATTIKTATQKVADKAAKVNEDAFYNIRNPFTTAKDEFNTAETKLMLNYISEQAAIDSDKVREYSPVTTNTPLSKKKEKKPLETRYSKQFKDNNPSLEVVGHI